MVQILVKDVWDGSELTTVEGQSWKYWEELPAQSKIGIGLGLIKPIVCPDCNGTGREST